jgi:dihydrolipoamide dehydrogenase
MLPLSGNPRAKMQGVRDGFVKLFARPGTGTVVGGVVVGPRASELIHPVAIAVSMSLTADQLAHAFTVYPSMSGSVAEAARRLHRFQS